MHQGLRESRELRVRLADSREIQIRRLDNQTIVSRVIHANGRGLDFLALENTARILHVKRVKSLDIYN
jgi:hypothetical protein